MAGITQKSSVAAFLLCSLEKQNSWLKRSVFNMKDIGRDFYYCLLAFSSGINDLKEIKEDKVFN